MLIGKAVSRLILLTAVFVALAVNVSLLGQRTRSAASPQPATPTPVTSTNSTGGVSTGPTSGGRREPCWEQAGISQQAIAQRRSLEQSARTQIHAVCSDASLTPQQRREKIRGIREQTQQQVQGLFTPQQLEALKACQASRRSGASAPPRIGGRRGPCGEELPAPSPAPTP